MSGPVRTPRGRRGTLAGIVALVGLLAAALGAIEAIWAVVEHEPWLVTADSVPHYLHRTRLADSVVLVVAVVATVVGALLLIAAAAPPRRRLIELTENDATVATGIPRRSVRRTLAAAATSVDGISGAEVKVRRRRITVRTATTLRNTEGLHSRVEAAVADRLDSLTLRSARTVRVTLKQKEG